jgi:hypothetical protein
MIVESTDPLTRRLVAVLEQPAPMIGHAKRLGIRRPEPKPSAPTRETAVPGVYSPRTSPDYAHFLDFVTRLLHAVGHPVIVPDMLPPGELVLCEQEDWLNGGRRYWVRSR